MKILEYPKTSDVQKDDYILIDGKGGTRIAEIDNVIKRSAAIDELIKTVQIEQEKCENLSNDMTGHKDSEVLDHPDGSVTTEKLKNGAVTDNKLSADLLKKINNSSSGGGTVENEEYATYNINTKYTGRDGLLKHTIAGKTTGLGTVDIANGLITLATRTTPLPKVKGTKGQLVSSAGMTVNIPELFAGSVDGHQDYCTEKELYQIYSDDIVLKHDWMYSYENIAGGNGVRIEFRIPVSELSGTPLAVATSSTADILQSALAVKSEDYIRALTAYSYYTHFVSFSYDTSNEYATMFIFTHGGSGKSGLKKALESAQFSFRYVLAVPKEKYNVDKLYIKSGEIVTFSVEDGYNSYGEITLKTPSNTYTAANGLEAVAVNINDLNYRVENVEVSSTGTAIGTGDGTTDDTAAIQAAINETKNANPEYAREVVLQPGVYRISQPLKMNIPNMTLRGEGEVILWATENNYEPIIRIMEGGCKVENIKIYLAKTNDDINYALRDNRISRGYPKAYKETMDTESLKYGDGHYCGIYIDIGQGFGDDQGLYGFYNVTIKDVIIQGAYRYSTKYIEKSYGIYAAKNGFCYFNRFENCHFNGVMCGMYLSHGCAPNDVQCTFDIGDNIYNISGASGNAITFQRNRCDDVIGCRWGIICDADASTIHVNGQCVGEDSMNPYVYDENGYEMPLDESTATVTGKQAYNYNTSTGEYTAISGMTTNGFADDISIHWKKLTESGVMVRNSYNIIDGMIYDIQRSDYGAFYFTSKAKYNKFDMRAAEIGYGKPNIAFTRRMYIPVEKDSNGAYAKWTEIKFIQQSIRTTDCGAFNVDSSPIIIEQANRFGAGGINSIDKYGITFAYPRTIDKVDDVAAFVDKYGSVKCYYTEDDGTETPITAFWKGDPADGKTTRDISSWFRPNNYDLDNGMYTGITFIEKPTEKNPIIIEIDFGGFLNGITIGDIRFNKFIARSIDVAYYQSNNTWSEYYNKTRDNVHGEYIWNTCNPNGTQQALAKIQKIRIRIGDAYQPAFVNAVSVSNNIDQFSYAAGDKYNPNGYVGISRIYIGDYNTGGSGYLTAGGGIVYGDIFVKRDGESEPSNLVTYREMTEYINQRLAEIQNTTT